MRMFQTSACVCNFSLCVVFVYVCVCGVCSCFFFSVFITMMINFSSNLIYFLSFILFAMNYMFYTTVGKYQ